MKIDRRRFLQWASVGTVGLTAASAAGASTTAEPPAGGIAMLTDTTTCVGCRKCEWACNQANALTDKPLESYEDTSVFAQQRRMDANAFTVINKIANDKNPEKPIYVKSQCMHCLEPACASACLVGALKRQDNGSVTYDAGKCMGCRYCMVACPFGVPAYEYNDAFTPEVRKCGFCFDRVVKEGKIPACAEMCPPMAITFGPREKVLALAHEKIASEPDRYYPKVYGEHEAGGTAFMYLASKPFEELGFLKLSDAPVPRLTETIQHSIFKHGLPPLMLFGLLGAAMNAFKDRGETDGGEEA